MAVHSQGLAGPGRSSQVRRVGWSTGALLDRWSFRRKLNILVTVPIVLVGSILSVTVANQVSAAQSAARVATLVRNSEQVATLMNDVQAEHRQALLVSVQYQASRSGDTSAQARYQAAQRDTDAQVGAVRKAFGRTLPDAEARALASIRGLAGLRQTIARGYVPAQQIDTPYEDVVDGLINGLGLAAPGKTASSTPLNLFNLVLLADADHAVFETSVFCAQTGDSNAFGEFARAAGAHKVFDQLTEMFQALASKAQASLLEKIETSADLNNIHLRFDNFEAHPSTLEARGAAQTRAALARTIASYPAFLQQAKARLQVTKSLIKDLAAQDDEASQTAWERTALLVGLAAMGFAAWLAFSFLVRRSVVGPVQALTTAAQDVARVTEAELARVADDDLGEEHPPRLQAVPVRTDDELGRLAEAFNRVQITASQLLEQQIRSRRNIAEMFGNIGRRVSNLTSRQLMLIDAVEHEETDPEVLERLYRIDHIAVRLKRNADSLVLLAGIRETGLEARPTALANVIRAALGQIEGYQRVSLRVDTEVNVAPDVVDDLTLMLAELLDNAVAFSPSDSSVEVAVWDDLDGVAGSDQSGGVTIEIIDHGLGLSPGRLAEENARLVRRERLDVVPTKVLGLFVVGILARRWGLRVALARTPGGGVTADVAVPSRLLLPTTPCAQADSASLAGTLTAAEPEPEETPIQRPVVLPQRRPSPAAAREGELPKRFPTPHRTASTAVSSGGMASEPGAAGAGVVQRGETEAGSREREVGGDEAEGRRRLQQRVRGATLATTTVLADRAVPVDRPLADAEAVRSELDEFEAAVIRAQRDSADEAEQEASGARRPQEGVEQ